MCTAHFLVQCTVQQCTVPGHFSLLEDLESLASRGYTEGFLRRHVHSEYQNYEYGVSKSERQRFVGEVVDVVDRDGRR